MLPIVHYLLDDFLLVSYYDPFVLELTERDVPGFAIGGLSGGEEKGQFWRMVTLSTDHLPRQKPRYLMGVGFVLSAVISTAFGCI